MDRALTQQEESEEDQSTQYRENAPNKSDVLDEDFKMDRDGLNGKLNQTFSLSFAVYLVNFKQNS